MPRDDNCVHSLASLRIRHLSTFRLFVEHVPLFHLHRYNSNVTRLTVP
jgi:hypothetical protein